MPNVELFEEKRIKISLRKRLNNNEIFTRYNSTQMLAIYFSDREFGKWSHSVWCQAVCLASSISWDE